ncbi:MAG: Adenylate cyclase 2 [Chloroflexi bacterium ADurb.Bin222]|nr:MAG: Adenylate cyclase 2 [Chloroflexi bacterium ADurb.Bin222]
MSLVTDFPLHASQGRLAGHEGELTHWFERLLYYQPALLLYLRDLLEVVTAYIPMTVAAPMLEAPVSGPIGLSLEGTVMFADIDGFTPLAERFSQADSAEGAEKLTDLVDRFLDILIRITAQYGGDLQKFGGDAGMVLFQGEQHALRAVAASLEFQAAMKTEMGEVETPFGRFPLRVAIGMGSGRMLGLGLGDRAGRELLPVGQPLATMGRAQSAAPPAETVLDISTFHACQGLVDCVPLNDDLYQVLALREKPSAHGVMALPQPPQLEDRDLLVWFLSRLDALTPYLALSLLERLVAAPTLDRIRMWSERRWVTVMMLAVTGLPDLLPYWGDEAKLQQTIAEPNTAFIQIRDAIQRYDGIVNKIAVAPSGAYIMALFGAPHGHEDDPLRAVLSALELQEMFGGTLSFGINTGYVFGGDMGTARRREYTVMGDEVNLAARLMSKCAPGQIWLGPNTSGHPAVTRRIAGEFGALTRFKGKAEPLAPFIARGLRQVFLGAPASEIPIVGRDDECAQLTRVLDAVLAGESRAVLLHGSAGVGKSRLVQELTRSAEKRGFAVHLGVTPSYAAHLPYAGWDAALTSLLGLDAASPEARQQTLEAVLERYGVAPWAALLAPLVGLTAPPSPDVLALPPTMRDTQRQSMFLELWQQAAREQPRLLILDNVHWMSSASLDMLDILINTPIGAPLLLVATHRDETADAYAPVLRRWSADEHVIDLPLGPLSDAAMETLVQRLFEDMPLPAAVSQWVAGRSSGLPLFATEAVRALINSGVLRRRDHSWELTGSLEDFPLPDMVYGLIQSRIDQLSPPDRHLLRAAAAVGDEMMVPTLVAAYGEESDTAVRRRIPQLSPFGLAPRDVEWLIFRQPLVREVAYRGLPHRIQRLIHQRLTEYLGYYREKAAPNWLTLMAYHAYEARMWEEAVAVNLELGQQAVRSYLAVQARQALERVLEAADAGGLAVPEARFEAHHLLGDTLISFGDYDAALSHLNAARAMLPAEPENPDDIARLADLDYHEATALEARGDYAPALAVVERGLARSGVERTLGGARLYLIGADLFRRRQDYEKARVWATRAIALATRFPNQEGQHVRSRATYMVALLASLQRLKGARTDENQQ